MISTVEILSGSANIGRYQKPPVVDKQTYLNSPLFYTEPTFFAMTHDQHKNSHMDSFLRPKPKHMTIMNKPHFPPMDAHVQKDPVNLAVFQSSSSRNDDNSDQKEIDVVGMDNNSYSSSLPAMLRTPKASYPKISESAYHHFNFNNFATSEPTYR